MQARFVLLYESVIAIGEDVIDPGGSQLFTFRNLGCVLTITCMVLILVAFELLAFGLAGVIWVCINVAKLWVYIARRIPVWKAETYPHVLCIPYSMSHHLGYRAYYTNRKGKQQPERPIVLPHGLPMYHSLPIQGEYLSSD